MLRPVEEPVEKRFASGTFLGRERPGPGLPPGHAPEPLPDPETSIGGLRQPGAERDTVGGRGGISSRGHVGIKGNGSFHHTHRLMVAPAVLPQPLP